MSTLYYRDPQTNEVIQAGPETPFPVYVVPDEPRGAIGYQGSLTVDNSAAGIFLTQPSGARRAVIQVFTAPIRYRVDGQAPTASTGYHADALGMIELASASEIAHFRAIREGGVSATLEVTYYG